MLRKSIDKPLYKEKVRLRSYSVPNEDVNVFLEINKKYKGVTNKRRIISPFHEINNYFENNVFSKCNKQIVKEIESSKITTNNGTIYIVASDDEINIGGDISGDEKDGLYSDANYTLGTNYIVLLLVIRLCH